MRKLPWLAKEHTGNYSLQQTTIIIAIRCDALLLLPEILTVFQFINISKVYKAVHRETRQTVALKKVRIETEREGVCLYLLITLLL